MAKPGRFVIDTHVHGQRHAVNFENQDADTEYSNLRELMRPAIPADEADENDVAVVYKNTDRIIHDMDTYGVDRCVLLPSFGMENRLHREMVQDYPDRFVAMVSPVQTEKQAVRSEEEWTIDRACEELDELLKHDEFRGIGEAAPYDPTRTEPIKWSERKKELQKVFDVAAKHDVPLSWHAGSTTGYSGGRSAIDLYPDWNEPELAKDLLSQYPDVPVIFNHGGMGGHWRQECLNQACEMAAAHDNVYLEVGLYWADLLEKPFNDANIGIDQLLWGTDWGASIVAHAQPHEDPPMYWDQVQERGVPAHQPDYWGTSLRQMKKYAFHNELPQDELNLLLGGNAARLLDIDPPHSRLFPEYL